MPTPTAEPVTRAEAKVLFAGLERLPALVLAVSGGPDSTALMVLAARWRGRLKRGPKLIAVTVDHGLRPVSKREAAAVKRLARDLDIAHRTLRWTGAKPKTGLQQAARAARYRLLARAAQQAGATHILTAHTLDDQAETVLIRMARGSGLTGLAAMSRTAPLPVAGRGEVALVRPLLDLPKARLIATLKAAKVPFAEDPSNCDPRFTRVRLRGLMDALAGEGLSAARLALLARRLRRADRALEAATDRAAAELAMPPPLPGVLAFDAGGVARLPAEIALRLIGRAVGAVGDEGPVELAKLESLQTALDMAQSGGPKRFRRSLAGALVTLKGTQILVERAPPRAAQILNQGRSRAHAAG
ncbi:MAG: tRNA lysidine(34) synthetase TilS [Pseudolabrys sp.]